MFSLIPAALGLKSRVQPLLPPVGYHFELCHGLLEPCPSGEQWVKEMLLNKGENETENPRKAAIGVR